MDSKNMKSIAKKNDKITVQIEDLGILNTCLSGIIMGFIAYNFSFSIVPAVFTLTALCFGTKSLITIFATAFAQLTAGYIHTHASRMGIAISTHIFHGFYINKPEMRNRRLYAETRYQGLKRFFFGAPLNAIVLNFMWQTFTIFYITQTTLFLRYKDNLVSETHVLIIHGITRYIAGCLSGMSTGLINHSWQRYLAHKKIPHAILNTNKAKLKLQWKDRKKLLSPSNMENWIKVSVMIAGASFFVLSNIPNITELHLLSTRQKRLITDLLVINGGWFFIRDSAMILFKKAEKPQIIPLNTIKSSSISEQNDIIDNEQSTMLPNMA
ncbi:unnamed protein product [Adineta steineri]|uniref:Uncharacterized protein n=1 Tax=Adineta steineri TaxID=433720 RepID=A0A819BJX2_9BILA|nr:unnamed protein product [Adineta steineri]CAF3803086.1 unnamed protein product [Adineta steineri]